MDVLLGNYENRQGLGMINVPLVDDKVAMRAVVQRIKRDGFGEDAAGHPIADDNVTSGRLHILAQPSDSLSILVSGDFVRQRNNSINYLPSADNMMVAGNAPNRGLGQIAVELGLDPNSAADRLTAYQAFRREMDQFLSGAKVFDTFGTDPAPDDVDLWGTSITVDAALGAGIDFKSITSYRWLEEKRLTASPFSFEVLTAPSSSQAENFSQELQLSSIDGIGLDWQLGLFYNHEDGNEFQAANINPLVNLTRIAAVADGDITNSSKAAYVQATYNFTSKVRFTGGLRYTRDDRSIVNHNRTDPGFANVPVPAGITGSCSLLDPALGGPVFPKCSYEASADFDAVTYLASVDYRPTDDLMIYLSHSKGYRTGGFTSQAPAARVASLAALDASFRPYDPETVYNYELGLKSEWFDRRLKVNAATYYQDYADIQQQIRDLTAVVNLIRNAAEGTIYGAELEVSASPVRQLQLNGGVSYVHARYDEFVAFDTAGNRLDLSSRPFPVPEWQFNLGAGYGIPLANGEVRLNVNYSWLDDQSFRPDATLQDSVSQDAYGLLDARLTWEIASADMEVALFGKNLTNEVYAISGTNLEGIGYNSLFAGDPRMYGIQLRKYF